MATQYQYIGRTQRVPTDPMARADRSPYRVPFARNNPPASQPVMMAHPMAHCPQCARKRAMMAHKVR